MQEVDTDAGSYPEGLFTFCRSLLGSIRERQTELSRSAEKRRDMLICHTAEREAGRAALITMSFAV